MTCSERVGEIGFRMNLENMSFNSVQKHAFNPYSPNYSYVFEFEENFDYRRTSKWFYDNWKTGFYWVVLYLVVVFGGQQWMSSRKPYKLRLALTLWNLSLAAFSIIGTLRTLPELIHVIREFGFAHSVCSNSFHTEVKVSSFWTWLFIVSKAPELGDTVFIVLRKQKLIFLHWYHHITVLLFTWYSYADEASAGRWYIDMNYIVHALMYSYYAVRALGFRVPRNIAMIITISQIVQMILGTYVTYYAYYSKVNNKNCMISYSTVYAGILMYISYFLLFAHFFVNSYFGSSSRSKTSQKIE